MTVIDNILAGSFGLAEWIALVAVVLLLLGIFQKGKTKEQGKMFLGIGAAGLALVFLAPGLLTGGTLSTTGGGLVTQSVVGCNVEDTTVTLSAVDEFTAVSAGTTHRYRIDNNPALTVSNAGTLTASPGDSIEILWGNESDAAYYGAVSTEVIPCSGTFTFSQDLQQNGTLTIEVFNEEGNLIDAAGENETLGVGDVVTLTANLKGQFQRGFPFGGVMIVEFNGTGATSVIDDVIVDFGGSEVPIPSFYVITLGTNSRTKAYSIPSISSNEILRGSITIDADDSNNPLDVGDPVLTFVPNDFFVDGDQGGAFSGPATEDEDDLQTFAHTTAFTVNLD